MRRFISWTKLEGAYPTDYRTQVVKYFIDFTMTNAVHLHLNWFYNSVYLQNDYKIMLFEYSNSLLKAMFYR